MLSGWSRAFLLLIVATLVGYAQCYVACGAIQPPSGSCHHKSPQSNDAGCRNSHAAFTETVAKAYVASTLPIIDVVSIDTNVAAPEYLDVASTMPGAPPGGSIRPTKSILRI